MSLVYNNDKPIGKCESYSIDKVPGTSPFVMLTNYEPLRSELNENQQIVFEWLKEVSNVNDIEPFTTILDLLRPTTYEDELDSAYVTLSQLTSSEQFEVLAAFAEWGMKEVAE